MIVLIGFMGAGKSTIGRLVADELGVPFVDSDDVIEARARMKVVEIFDAQGEQMFRTLEREVVGEILSDDDGVVALGGGALVNEDVREQLRRHTVVHLDVSVDEALRRIGETDRPMLRSSDPKELFRSRAATYAASGAHVVQVDGRTPEDVAREVISKLRSSLRRVALATATARYDVVIGEDLLGTVGSFLEPVPRRVAVLHQPSVEAYAKEVADALGRVAEVLLLPMPDGEAAKSPGVVSDLWTRLADAELNRGDALVTVGGGAVCDTGGFLASTYMRGLRVVHVPTTLLGQVDAAVGGKTAINLAQGKNLVGTVYQPTAVLCDVRTLSTLPIEEFRSGCAEVIKYGFIADPDLARAVASDPEKVLAAEPRTLLDVVERCVTIKAAVVGDDEHDRGRRKILNYGHTFAHAFELQTGFSLRHGEAVALGMTAAALTAQELGWLGDDEVRLHRETLAAFALPTQASFDLEDLRAAWRRDKKTTDGPRFVLLRALGRPEIDVEVDDDVLRTALARLAA